MGTSDIPFPSFTLVLTSGRVIIPGRSMVIRIEPPVIQNVHNNIMVGLSLRTCMTCDCNSCPLQKTIDIHSENLVVSLENDSVSPDSHIIITSNPMYCS